MTEETKRKIGHTHLASEFYVLSAFHRKQVDAYLTLANQKAVDIVVINKNHKAITVDVKGNASGYSQWRITPKVIDKSHFIIFLGWGKGKDIEKLNNAPETFIVPSIKLNSIMIKEGRVKYKGNKELYKYKDKWELITEK